MTTRRERGLARKLYRTPIEYFLEKGIDLSLAADQYGATMAYAWWKNGMAERKSYFNWFFRENPFGGGYAVFLGLAAIQHFLDKLHISEQSIDYLAMLNGRDGKPLFPDEGFFDFLSNFKNQITVHAFEEGSVCFPRQPVVRFNGPVWQIQMWEAFFLNQLNFWTLIGTKSARMVDTAKGKPISESGFRRAQGLDGHLTAALASYCGGAAGTSNLLAGQLFGLPTYGTHAHSFVSSYGNDLDAFTGYSNALPNNSVFLVDTFDTLQGVEVAIQVAINLEKIGHQAFGIRLDSGDLLWLGKEARKMLDSAGLHYMKIIASDRLNEHKIGRMQSEGSMIDIYAPGTELATGGQEPALGGVLKLVAIEDENGVMQDRIKISVPEKTTIPGILEIIRFKDDSGLFIGDCIYDPRDDKEEDKRLIVNPANLAESKKIPADADFDEMLKLAFSKDESSKKWWRIESIEEVREKVHKELSSLHPSVRRLDEPHKYPAGISANLDARIRGMIIAARSR
ncbi:MAG TPA: nicotinate phosphoribosyltransferase [Oligoflexia bacterium]|nr:nicotinate phosphoribosyltransferase [Oligoflexia bacterium]HMP48380.1 nicotinate phosphoribosyltransferase [Oligoflexia bacterium]